MESQMYRETLYQMWVECIRFGSIFGSGMLDRVALEPNIKYISCIL